MQVSHFRLLAVAAFAGLVVACAVKPVSHPPTASEAAKLEAEQQYRAAAQAWLAVASAATEPSSIASYRLRAARDFERQHLVAKAWDAIGGVSIASLPPSERLVGAEAKARIALDARRPEAALATLASMPAVPGRAANPRLLELKGRALFDAGNPAGGLETLVTRGKLAGSPAEVLVNDELVWNLLMGASTLPSAEGLSLSAQGWIALAQIWRTAWEAPQEFAARLTAWQAAYPNHPAQAGLLAEIEAQEKSQLTYPPQIAVLLPLSGPYAQQARAVESGVLDAYYRSGGTRPHISVYDTNGTAPGARAAMSRALADGVDFVFGPLTAAGVRAVASSSSGVPVLALNYLDGGESPPRFFQFGLSPTEEAAQSAERAVSQGLVRAVVLVPANDWGQSIASSFDQALVDLGGATLASATFRVGSEDFGAPLSQLFGLNASEEREQRLSALLGRPLGFEPRRRQDIQFVFFAARYTTARLVVPQIRYYHGFGLPVFSISDVYRPGAVAAGLNGVRFPVMPWFIADSGPIADMRQSIHALFPKGWDQLAPLYALGYDAWRLVPMLANSRQPLTRPVRGMTGLLSLGPGNVIERRLDWARYAAGNVKPYPVGPSS